MIPTPAVASADVLRTMAHELRQPLSTIESIAYYLTLVLPDGDQKVHAQLERIQQLVEQSNWIVTSAQQLADPLRVTAKPARLDELIGTILAERTMPDGPRFEVEGQLPPANIDAGLARAMVENLLTLFALISSAEFPAKLILRPADDGVLMIFATDAPGYKSEASLGPGAAMSLESARRMAAANGGALDLRLDPAKGVRVRVMLP